MDPFGSPRAIIPINILPENLAQLFAEAKLRKWSPEEDEVISSLYPNFGLILDKFRHRSIVACRKRAKRLGLHRIDSAWRDEELRWLRKNYETATWDEIRHYLPRRTIGAVKAQAHALRLYREPRELPRTGVYLFDEIRARAKELNFTLRDLDEVANTKRYFRRSRSSAPPVFLRLAAIEAVLKAMDGRLVVEWSDV